MSKDIFGIERTLKTSHGESKYFSLRELEKQGKKVSHLPFSIRVLLENALRNYDGFSILEEHLHAILNWKPKTEDVDIPFMPSRVLMQDFTGVPAVVDLASLRAEVARKGKDTDKINPLVPVDLVIDHSVQVLYSGTAYAYQKNVEIEFEQNLERYQLLKWAQKSFQNFRVVPPGMGICHQVNLEYLCSVITNRDGYAFPDTLVGTDSHTPMVNGLGVVAWGVGGIEAEAAMLGQPIVMQLPEVIGLELKGNLPEGATATDLVLAITELLRKYGVVGKFVEVLGKGLENLAVTDRATISNMSPEFGCTVTYFPIDNQTLNYMKITARSDKQIELVEKYAKENLLWRENEDCIQYTDKIILDLSTIVPAISGPKRPQDRILLTQVKPTVAKVLETNFGRKFIEKAERNTNVAVVENAIKTVKVVAGDQEYTISDGQIVLAAITSCTNTSNPSVMLGAGLVAKKAIQKGLNVKPWVKTSLAPGSKVVTTYLEKSGLLEDLEALRFHVVGYGCTTCIGNSGDLLEPITKAIVENDLNVAAVLSGNRNFEARIHPNIKMNFLASPMLVVAYAIAGRIDIDLYNEPLGYDPNLQPVYLKDIWPTPQEIQDVIQKVLLPEDFRKVYSTVFDGDESWQKLQAPEGKIFQWNTKSTYIQEAPFFKNISMTVNEPQDIKGAKVLLSVGDSITTDHISPAGNIKANSPAGQYLIQNGVDPKDFNSYGSRRGNHEVMIRGTFANVRLKNKLVSKEGGFTLYDGQETTIYEASMNYQAAGVPLIVLAGKEYGSGSSRDWAAKGTNLLGIKAVIAESYERIHRSNLVGMGVLPLQFINGQNVETLGLTGHETFEIQGISEGLTVKKVLNVVANKPDGTKVEFQVLARLDSPAEIAYLKNGGILQFVLRRFLN